jgi:hypothetical protein
MLTHWIEERKAQHRQDPTIANSGNAILTKSGFEAI